MKFTLGWLREHLDTTATPERIAAALTALGIEVEGLHDPAATLGAFTAAYVVEAVQHPNADKLRVCRVETADGTVQVVCGAPNARTGMTGLFAPVGSTVPSTGLVLTAAKIRGVESHGMLVSERELGLSDEHTGIIELPAAPPVGTPAAAALGLDDPVFEVAITPNRPDCLGVRGIARDLAATGIGTLRPDPAAAVAGRFPSPIAVGLHFAPGTEDACPIFAGRLIRRVANGPSPEWLQRRLRAVGLRPISALVDITNYVSYDRARPLHVFDAAKVQGEIHARLAKSGEAVAALDGRAYTLDDTMTVIADETGALSIAGIMGGEPSAVTTETRDVFIESAWFDPIRAAATGRRLNIASDARYRFERGTDPEFVVPGLELATRLVLDLCGGEPGEVVVAGEPPDLRRRIAFDPARTGTLAGLDIAPGDQEAILISLGFAVRSDGTVIEVTTPSWRPDVMGAADLVEEVARVHGYDRIPALPLPPVSPVTRPAVSPAQNRVRWAKRALAARGLAEAVTWSFTARAAAAQFGGGDESLLLENPISSELDAMRPNLLPNLLAAAQRNADRGAADFGLFEVGPQYAGDRPEDQATAATALRLGAAAPRHWAGGQRAVDALDAKADALAVLEACGAPVDNLQVTTDAPVWYHPGRSGVLRLGPKALGYFGEIHPRVLEALDIAGAPIGCEVLLDAIPPTKVRPGKARPILDAPDLMPVERDFAFVLDRDVPAANVLRAVRGADKALIQSASVFDVFEHPSLGEGRKSLAIAVTLQPRERTMTDAEIEAVAARIVAAVEKATGGRLRA